MTKLTIDPDPTDEIIDSTYRIPARTYISSAIEPIITTGNYFATHRQLWIAECLFVYGFINRVHLRRKFGISIPQASNDLSVFIRNNPSIPVIYDYRSKIYRLDFDKIDSSIAKPSEYGPARRPPPKPHYIPRNNVAFKGDPSSKK